MIALDHNMFYILDIVLWKIYGI